MIGYLKGKIVGLQATQCYIEINNIGYEVQITLNTYEQISGKEETQLFIYNHIREDQHILFGFASLEEKQAFEWLTSVSGIGSQTGRMILSSMTPDEVYKAIRQENKKMLQTVKGIGKKTAERMILELKDKIPEIDVDLEIPAAEHNTMEADALKALMGLGIPRPNANKAIQKALKESSDLIQNVENLIKLSLKNL